MAQTIDYGTITDINHLRSRLHELKGRKNELLASLRDLSGRIQGLISVIKEKKVKRNALTDSVKAKKLERGALSQEIRERIEEVKKVQPSTPARPLGGAVESPGRLKARLDELNRRIETEAMPFEKEQQLMKQIKEIKAGYDKAIKESSARQDTQALSRRINELKAKADASHDTVQQQAKESQAIHEEILALSKEVESLQSEESKIKDSYLGAKKEFDDVAKRLDAIQSKVRDTDAKEMDRSHREHEDKTRRRLSQRIDEVNEKIKRGGKLTTEDLIILQGAKEGADDK